MRCIGDESLGQLQKVRARMSGRPAGGFGDELKKIIGRLNGVLAG